jgi:hypothetical protein
MAAAGLGEVGNELLGHMLTPPAAMAAGLGLAYGVPRLARGLAAVPRSVLRNPVPTAFAGLGATNALFPQVGQREGQ